MNNARPKAATTTPTDTVVNQIQAYPDQQIPTPVNEVHTEAFLTHPEPPSASEDNHYNVVDANTPMSPLSTGMYWNIF